MKTLKTLEPLTRRLLEIQRVNSAASVLSWDQETYMPAGGGAARAEQIATLQGIAHQRLVSLETERLLGGWLDLHTGLPLEQDGELWDESSRALLREVWRLQPFQKITVRFCHAVESRVLLGATGVGRSKSAKQFQIVPAQPANGLVAEA
jgi:Zn-dependent M32 family carboxypeptidase